MSADLCRRFFGLFLLLFGVRSSAIIEDDVMDAFACEGTIFEVSEEEDDEEEEEADPSSSSSSD